jgi:hypothetical protein
VQVQFEPGDLGVGLVGFTRPSLRAVAADEDRKCRGQEHEQQRIDLREQDAAHREADDGRAHLDHRPRVLGQRISALHREEHAVEVVGALQVLDAGDRRDVGHHLAGQLQFHLAGQPDAEVALHAAADGEHHGGEGAEHDGRNQPRPTGVGLACIVDDHALGQAHGAGRHRDQDRENPGDGGGRAVHAPGKREQVPQRAQGRDQLRDAHQDAASTKRAACSRNRRA